MSTATGPEVTEATKAETTVVMSETSYHNGNSDATPKMGSELAKTRNNNCKKEGISMHFCEVGGWLVDGWMVVGG